MKKVKLTEDQVRKIIREHVLQEFKVFNQSLANISTCERIDLPDSMFASRGGRAAIKKAEKTAAFAAQLYGVPGMFCNFISAVMGDNSGFEPNRPDNTSSSGSGRNPRFVQNVVYTGEAEWASKRKALFIATMVSYQNGNDRNKKNAVDKDLREYKALINKVKNARSQGTAVKTVKEINSVLGLPNKGSVRKARQLVSAQNGNEEAVKDRAIKEALELLRSTTNRNLLAVSDKFNSDTSAADLKASYDTFFSFTSS